MTGTGTMTLLGAVTSFQDFSVVGNGVTTPYAIAEQSGTDWEVGIGTYTLSGTTLSRTTVLASSNSGSLVSFGSGTKSVFQSLPAYACNRLGYTLGDHVTDVGSVSTTETPLYSDTLAANTFLVNGDKVQCTYGLTLSSGTATKQVRMYLGSTAIFDSGALTLSTAGDLIIMATIIRDTSTSVRYLVSVSTTGASTGAFAAVGKLTGLTLTGTNTVMVTGQSGGVGSASNDVTAILGTIIRFPGA